MKYATVVAILWTLVAVSLVLYFDAVVTVAVNQQMWSQVRKPHPVVQPYHIGYTK